MPNAFERGPIGSVAATSFQTAGSRSLLHAGQDSVMLARVERDHAIATLKAHQVELQKLGVVLFGSTARGEAREDSDVDLFFDYQEGKFGLFDLMDVQEHASRILGGPADVMTRDSIHKMLRPRIEAIAVRVF